VYKLHLGVGGWRERILYSFQGGHKDGDEPVAGVVVDAAGNVYGTTAAGGGSEHGTVFELMAPVRKGGSYREKVLRSFDTEDGSQPLGSLTLDGAGNLYGTTFGGGTSGYGTVFEVTP
jgi:uncharacterized repeat protein (TIGR03803 family)